MNRLLSVSVLLSALTIAACDQPEPLGALPDAGAAGRGAPGSGGGGSNGAAGAGAAGAGGVGAGGDGSGAAGGRGGVGAGGVAGGGVDAGPPPGCDRTASFSCVSGKPGDQCGDALEPAVCANGAWQCRAGTIPVNQCRCIGRPPAGCTCGERGWVCPRDGGAAADAPLACSGENPATRCRTAANQCIPSGCGCSGGGWACTADCNGGRSCGPDAGPICKLGPACDLLCRFGNLRDANGCLDLCKCAASCEAQTDPGQCAASDACAWVEPGCGSAPPTIRGLPRAICVTRTAVGCRTAADCDPKQTCDATWVNPCPKQAGGVSCDACGGTRNLCF